MAWTAIYYESAAGQSPVEEFLDGLSEKDQARCFARILWLADFDPAREVPPSEYVHHIRGDLYALRQNGNRVIYRFLFARISGSRIALLHAIVKKTQELPEADIRIAETRLGDLRLRGLG